MSKHILTIVANPSISTTLGFPVGFWASELIHPYDAFIQAAGQQQHSGAATANLVLASLGV